MTRASAYTQAGVDIDAGEATLKRAKQAVQATYTPDVLNGLGAFGGLFSGRILKGMDDPVLVASTDGVGTKTKLAHLNEFATIGQDIVHHCVNDILVQGALPLFFLDYVAAARLEPVPVSNIIKGVAAACQDLGIALLGGETAEMPGVYVQDEFDLVGTVVGAVDKKDVVTGSTIKAGDVVLALGSGGLQTNGFSLARRVLGAALDETFANHTVGLELLTPHRHYLTPVRAVREAVTVKGMAHVTGGGIVGNLPRILPGGLGANIRLGSWDTPEIFQLIQARGDISTGEMHRVFNMGAGFLIVVADEDVPAARAVCPEALQVIGEIVKGDGVHLNA